MSGNKGTLEKAYSELDQELQNPRAALAVLKYYQDSFPEEKGVVNSSKKGGQRNRRPANKFKVVKSLPGTQSAEIDFRIRAIVGMRYQGIPDRKIEESLGLYQKAVNEYEIRHPEAFDAAESDAAALIMRDYYRNVNVVRAAVGESGPLAVETLRKLMNDSEAKDEVRLRAAKAILDLLDVGSSPVPHGAAATIDAVTNTIKTVYDITKDSQRESTIVATVEAEDEN